MSEKLMIYVFDQSHNSRYELDNAFLNSLFMKVYNLDTLVNIIVKDFIDVNHLKNTFETKQESGRRKLVGKTDISRCLYKVDLWFIFI
jgi:hypothetical protein